MNDEDERVTEFIKILSSAVEREAENKILRAQRDEMLEALEWYAKQTYALHYYGGSSSVVWELCEDRGKRAMEAISKVKGGNNE